MSEGIPLRDYLENQFEMIEWDEIRPVVQELQAKSERVQSFLRPVERIASLTRDEIDALLDMIFVARRNRNQIVEPASNGAFKNAVAELLYGENPDLGARLDGFLAQTRTAFEPCAAFEPCTVNQGITVQPSLSLRAKSAKQSPSHSEIALLRSSQPQTALLAMTSERLHPGKGVELAGELLHFAFPERYWLWSRWMYDPESRTGVLPLLLDGDKELRGDSLGATYLRVGRAIAMVTQVEDARWIFRGGLSDSSAERPFAIDVSLASAWGAYLYGVTAWRLSREFHKVLPPLPRLVRRLLGLKVELPVNSNQ